MNNLSWEGGIFMGSEIGMVTLGDKELGRWIYGSQTPHCEYKLCREQ